MKIAITVSLTSKAHTCVDKILNFSFNYITKKVK